MILFYKQYINIAVLFIFSAFLASIIFFLSFRLGTFNPDTEKLSPYECGFVPYEDARNTFDVTFYLVAILFIIFDLEAAFFFSWCVSVSFLSLDGVWGMFDFIFELLFGYLYGYKIGAFNFK